MYIDIPDIYECDTNYYPILYGHIINHGVEASETYIPSS